MTDLPGLLVASLNTHQPEMIGPSRSYRLQKEEESFSRFVVDARAEMTQCLGNIATTCFTQKKPMIRNTKTASIRNRETIRCTKVQADFNIF